MFASAHDYFSRPDLLSIHCMRSLAAGYKYSCLRVSKDFVVLDLPTKTRCIFSIEMSLAVSAKKWPRRSRHFKTSFERSPEDSIYRGLSAFDVPPLSLVRRRVSYTPSSRITRTWMHRENKRCLDKELIVVRINRCRDHETYTHYQIYSVHVISETWFRSPMSRHAYTRQTCLYRDTQGAISPCLFGRHYRILHPRIRQASLYRKLSSSANCDIAILEHLSRKLLCFLSNFMEERVPDTYFFHWTILLCIVKNICILLKWRDAKIREFAYENIWGFKNPDTR